VLLVGSEEVVALALLVRTLDRPGVLHQLTEVIGEHRANITHVDISDRRSGSSSVYFELEEVADSEALKRDLSALEIVEEIEEATPARKLWGKRIIVIGGGAQVGQVAVGAISEADRHNIRGERISVDTIPLVGEQNLAAAVRGVARLPRVRALVMAGALMGGEITEAVLEGREKGISVISLNMAGSVPDAADLVVSDPVQAGVMTVMHVADTAKFNIDRIRGQRF
jgi:energy-converting hydrogenase B subunit Q